MSSRTVIPISAHPQVGKIREDDYFRLYRESLADPDRFWGEHGKRIDWIKPFTKVQNASFAGDVHIAWYEDGRSTLRTTASTATCRAARSKPRSSGRATIPAMTAASPTANCTKRCVGLPMF